MLELCVMELSTRVLTELVPDLARLIEEASTAPITPNGRLNHCLTKAKRELASRMNGADEGYLLIDELVRIGAKSGAETTPCATAEINEPKSNILRLVLKAQEVSVSSH